MNRLAHEWDDDACCIHCGFDGAEDHWLKSRLRLEIGNDEFNYRRHAGEFDAGRYCPKRENDMFLDNWKDDVLVDKERELEGIYE